MSMRPLISVCVCTYKRPDLLRELLNSLVVQSSYGFRYEIVVVDNDKTASAQEVVQAVARCHGDLGIRYEVEPIQGISFARNYTVRLAEGEFLAFIDDDEIAAPNWLADLFTMLHSRDADAVFGPILPIFPKETAGWVINSRLFERPRFKDGGLVGSGNSRTGNALVKASWCRRRNPTCFKEALAHSGGEDHDFFKWVEASGGRLVWCDTATVSEIVPPERQKLGFVLERRFRASVIYWQGVNAGRSMTRALMEGVIGALGGSVFLAIGALMLPMGLDKSVRAWVKAINGFGRLVALTGIKLVGYGSKE